jgi:hypothetical protein
MILILCPKCDRCLGVRLDPDDETAAWCRSCRKPLNYEYLIRNGLPSGLIARLMEWAKKSTDLITGLGAGLDDAQFVNAWKELRDETGTLLEAWRRFVETDADVLAEVFDLKPTASWSDEAISGWRRLHRRLRDLSWYGYVIGCRWDARTGIAPYPTGATSDEDREAFRCGFNVAIEFRHHPDPSNPFGQELADLESKYGGLCST